MEKTTTTTTTCGDLLPLLLLLPEDFLIQEILVRLPVKSLLRFKTVCKSWLSLIQTPFFIDLHTTTTTTFNSSSSSSSKFGAFIIQTIEYPGREYGGEIKLFKLSSGDGDGEGDDDDQKKKKKMVFKVDDLGYYPFYKDTQMSYTQRMVGSCNGIICLHDGRLMDESKGGIHRQYYSSLRDVCLWNPATRQFRILPKSIPIQEKQYYMGDWMEDFIAFGFDIKTKDYKVLRITPWEEPEEGGCMCRAQVYSLSTDSWRLLEGINSLPVTPNQSMSLNSGIYQNGSYFFGDFYRGKFMLSFDFTKEIFTTMRLPDDNSSSVLSCLGEKLAVFTTPRIDDDHESGYEYYDIWVLNEQQGSDSSSGVNKESWTKLHSFRINSREFPHSEPRCISNNGEFALISINDDVYEYVTSEKLQLFNLVTKEAIKDFTIGNRKRRVCVYKESLVSIMGGNVFLGGSSQSTRVEEGSVKIRA